MSDLIDRQAAIDALNQMNLTDADFGYICGAQDAAEIIEQLPSAQPEPDAFKQRLMIYLADLQLTYSPGWGANGCGDDKLYEFVTGLIEEIESW